MNVRLITPGAACTYQFAEVLGLMIKGGDETFNPHRRNTDIDVDRVLYVCSNPYDTILSYDRRRFLLEPDHCVNIQGACDYFEPSTLRGYLERGIDVFGLAHHAIVWTARKKFPVMFCKYDALGSFLDIPMAWLGSSKSFEFEKRSSCWQDQPADIIDGLQKVYGEWFETYNKLPDIFIS